MSKRGPDQPPTSLTFHKNRKKNRMQSPHGECWLPKAFQRVFTTILLVSRQKWLPTYPSEGRFSKCTVTSSVSVTSCGPQTGWEWSHLWP